MCLFRFRGTKLPLLVGMRRREQLRPLGLVSFFNLLLWINISTQSLVRVNWNWNYLFWWNKTSYEFLFVNQHVHWARGCKCTLSRCGPILLILLALPSKGFGAPMVAQFEPAIRRYPIIRAWHPSGLPLENVSSILLFRYVSALVKQVLESFVGYSLKALPDQSHVFICGKLVVRLQVSLKNHWLVKKEKSMLSIFKMRFYSPKSRHRPWV